MTNWREAAEKYQKAQPEFILAEWQRKIEHAAAQLADFLGSSLGKEALGLLKASRRLIVFGEDDSTSANIRTWFLCRHGLQQTCGVGGLAGAYTRDCSSSVCRKIDAIEAVESAVKYGHKDPENLIRWLREELDKIAAAAPEPGTAQLRG